MPDWLAVPAFFVLRPSNLLLLLLAGGLGLAVSKQQFRRSGIVLAAIATAGLAVCGFGPVGSLMLRPLEDRFAPPDHGAPAPDGIILLGGFIDEHTTASRRVAVLNARADRLIATVALSRNYPHTRVIVTDGPPQAPDGVPLGANLARTLLVELGVDPARIVVEPRARSTWQNATFSKALVKPQPGQRWLIVPSAFHMPRAIGAFRAAGWTGLEPWPVGYLTARDPLADLGQTSVADGLSAIDLAAREYLALIAYRLAGRSSAWLPGPLPTGTSPAGPARPSDSSASEDIRPIARRGSLKGHRPAPLRSGDRLRGREHLLGVAGHLDLPPNSRDAAALVD